MKPITRPRSTLSMPANLHCSQSNTSTGFIVDPTYKKNSFSKHPVNNSKNPNEYPKENKDPATFSNRYKEVCTGMHIQPLNMVKVLLSNVSLDITCDRIKMIDLAAILKTVQEDRSLHYICFKSKLRGFVIQEHIDTERKAKEADKVLYTRYMLDRIAECLRECVIYSENLKALKILNIPFSGNSIHLLSQGLSKTGSLQHLSLEQCGLGDDGCAQLCRALHGLPTLLTLDLSACALSPLAAQHVAALIKGQEIARFEQSWKQSLRYRKVNNNEMKGLRRVTLNDNPDIGDLGFKMILDVLLDDFWIRALDVQNCGITDIGAKLAMEMIETNNEICVLDLRRNPLIDNSYVAAIVKAVSEQTTPENAEYGWLHLPKPKKVLADQSECNSTVINHPWNRGPGIKKAKSVSFVDQSAKNSIMKVNEWKISRENIYSRNTLSTSNTERAADKCVTDQKLLYVPNLPNNLNITTDDNTNTSESPQPESTDRSDDSQLELNSKVQSNEEKMKENIHSLFCEFINSPGMKEVILH